MTDSEILEWIHFAKGGPGSGAQPGHEFEGNQWSGQQTMDARAMSTESAGLSDPEYRARTPEELRDAADQHMMLAGDHMQAAQDLDEHSQQAQLHYAAADAHVAASTAARVAADATEGPRAENARESTDAYARAASNATRAGIAAASSMAR